MLTDKELKLVIKRLNLASAIIKMEHDDGKSPDPKKSWDTFNNLEGAVAALEWVLGIEPANNPVEQTIKSVIKLEEADPIYRAIVHQE